MVVRKYKQDDERSTEHAIDGAGPSNLILYEVYERRYKRTHGDSTPIPGYSEVTNGTHLLPREAGQTKS